MKRELTRKTLRFASGLLVTASVIVPVIIASLATRRYFHHRLLERQQVALLGTLRLLERSLPPQLDQSWCERMMAGLPFRLTVFRISDAVRLCDSASPRDVGLPVMDMDTRPEFVKALQAGEAVSYRESLTLGEPLVYSLLRTTDQKNLLRMGFSLNQLEEDLAMMDRRIAMGSALLLLILIIFNGVYFRSISLGLSSLLKNLDARQISFLDQAAHELRTPLSALLSGVATLKNTSNLTQEERLQFLDIVARNAERLRSLTQQFLKLSSLELSRLEKPEKMPVDLDQVTEKVLQDLQPLALAKQIKLQTEFNTHNGIGEIDIFEQILTNYLSNAIKYSPPGSAVKIIWTEDPQHTRLCVEDQGPGIYPQDLPHVFDRFFRARAKNSERHNASGYGLGLAIVEKLVSQLDGRVWVENRDPESGARFYAQFRA